MNDARWRAVLVGGLKGLGACLVTGLLTTLVAAAVAATTPDRTGEGDPTYAPLASMLIALVVAPFVLGPVVATAFRLEPAGLFVLPPLTMVPWFVIKGDGAPWMVAFLVACVALGAVAQSRARVPR